MNFLELGNLFDYDISNPNYQRYQKKSGTHDNMEHLVLLLFSTVCCILTQFSEISTATIDKSHCTWEHTPSRDFVAPSLLDLTGITNPETCKTKCLEVAEYFIFRYHKTTQVCQFYSHTDVDEYMTEYRRMTDIYFLDCTGVTPVVTTTTEPTEPPTTQTTTVVTTSESFFTNPQPVVAVVAEGEDLLSLRPEYLVLIGMGCLVILLLITAVASIFLLSGDDRK